MTETVRRLIRLRQHALLINAVCYRWLTKQLLEFSLIEQSTLLTRQLARVTTAWLFGLPSRRLHPDASKLAGLELTWRAWIQAVSHRSDEARLRWLNTQIGRLDIEAATIHAINPSPQINEMLGRHQTTLYRLTSRLRTVTALEAAQGRSGRDTPRRLSIFVPQDRWPHFSA